MGVVNIFSWDTFDEQEIVSNRTSSYRSGVPKVYPMELVSPIFCISLIAVRLELRQVYVECENSLSIFLGGLHFVLSDNNNALYPLNCQLEV